MSAIEQALQGYATSQAIAPPPGLKAQIMDAIGRESGTMSSPARSGAVAFWALRLLTLGLFVAATFFYCQRDKALDEKTALSKQVADIEVRVNACDQSLQDMNGIIKVLRDPETRPVKMSDNPSKPSEAKVSTYVFSNIATRCKVLLDMGGMPGKGPEKHFQMWALVDGKPVSMGMIDLESPGGLQEFECIQGAAAYAVSVEDKPAGNPVPTVVLLVGPLTDDTE